jgi:catechol 2,3-dioxygenase-like lactoylglutathione lyase family enzyme
MTTMKNAPARHARLLLAALTCLAFTAPAQRAAAQLSPPNAAGVAMGHLHYSVRDVEANKQFWIALGGTPTQFGTNEVIRFPDVLVLLREGGSSGGTEGSVVNHVAFRVKSVAAIEAAGFEVHYNDAYPGVVYVYSPEGERIELFDDEIATNLGFTPSAGHSDPAAERHNRKIDVPIIAHHIHLHVPDGDVAAAQEWYATHFGGTPGLRWRYEATDFPGINLNFSAIDSPTAPTQGRMLDHIGFEVENLEAFCRGLEERGIVFDRPYQKLPSGFGLAFLTDPWGTYIELTEGLREL